MNRQLVTCKIAVYNCAEMQSRDAAREGRRL